MSMLLLHASPHRHNGCRPLEAHENTQAPVSVDFEIHDQEHHIGYDVDIQCWSNIDGTWKGYPLTVYRCHTTYPRHILYRQLRLEDLTRQVRHVRYNGKWYTYRTHGFLLAKRPGRYECTFRGRYKAKYTDEWSQWYWIGERDHFGPGRNAYITVHPIPVRLQRMTTWTDVCYHCLTRGEKIRPPHHILKWLDRMNSHRWFRCIVCRHSFNSGIQVPICN